MFPAWTWIVGFWIGAAIGSFLNVVIYRLPRGLSIYKPQHSFCPGCQRQLTVAELIPILSWVLQKGKCKCGKGKIGARYVLVELITGGLWAAIWYQQLIVGSDPVRAIGYSLFAAALVAAIFTDLAHYIIPDQVNAFMFGVGVAMNVATIIQGRPDAWMWGMPSSLAGALVGVGVLWGIAFLGRILFRKDAMGHGDIKMARGIGAVLLVANSLISFGVAVVLGAVIGIVQILARRRTSVGTAEEEDDEPYVPESIGSLCKSLIGYLLLIDIIGLVWPRLYEKWFGENPYAVEEFEEEPEVELTMIPFGPYLAMGALGLVLFEGPLRRFVDDYLKQMLQP